MRIKSSFAIVLMLLPPLVCMADGNVEQWGRYEKVFKGPTSGNPFADVLLTAKFWKTGQGDTVNVTGFYDGDGKYVIRFMPTDTGEWNFQTSSNVTSLSGKSGGFTCTPAVGNRGQVKVRGIHSFQYYDGTPYYPIGTTAYAWIHTSDNTRRQTLSSLAAAKFNKVRMCVLPKYYELCQEEPELYPFPVTKQTDKMEFDFSRFNPAFFHHIEKCIDDLNAIGVEADLILFHPYDKGHWGFDSMSEEVNMAYVRYVCARLTSFSNVWWSLSNEYDYVKAKTETDWIKLVAEVRKSDPYGHLCSIHGSTATYFPYWMDNITHTSIQDEAPVEEAGRASILYSIYRKPVIIDEACYEGNLEKRWGRLSGQEMLHRIWQGLINGIYVTHGECFKCHEDTDTIFWAKGGIWRGESWKRIPFTREIIESLPNPPQMADISRDNQTSTAGDGYYLVYFGKQTQDSWLFNLPVKNANYGKLKPGTRFKVEIIDTWNMTVTPWPEIMETGKAVDYRLYDKEMRKIRLPLVPYLMLRITAV